MFVLIEWRIVVGKKSCKGALHNFFLMIFFVDFKKKKKKKKKEKKGPKADTQVEPKTNIDMFKIFFRCSSVVFFLFGNLGN
jgi:hypothetical protein